MPSFAVTTSNWNSSAFWSGISTSGIGQTLDFSALPATYSVTFDAPSGTVTLSNGSTAYVVKDTASGASADVTLGGSSLLSHFDTVLGGDGVTHVYGSAEDETITSGSGDDTIDSGSGSDTIILEDAFGNDTIIGGEGGTDDDTIDLSGLTGAVTVTYSGDEAGTITNGSDTVTFSEIETLILTDHDDSVVGFGTGIGREVYAGGGADTVIGSNSADTIYGGDGNDDLRLEDGDDTAIGGIGNDSLSGADGNDSMDGGTGQDTLRGGNGADTMLGGAGDDLLMGWNDADLFVMADGFGNDTIGGGEGTTSGIDDDVIDLSAMTVSVLVTYTGDEAGAITDDTDTITFSEIERVITTDLADIVDGSGQSGTAGINVDTRDGADTVTGTNNADTIVAGDGNDSVDGGSGADSIEGGADHDTISGDGGNDTIDGGSGNDSISGGGSADSVLGGTGNDTLQGDGGADTIFGGDDGDILDGGDGNDVLSGDAGNDTLLGQSGDDDLQGGVGNDLLFGHSGQDTLVGSTGNDQLTGGDNDDIFVFGVGDGADTISDFNTGNSGALGDGDTTNNDFIDLSSFYTNMSELRADFDDDGVLNQSTGDYSDNTAMAGGDSLTFTGATTSSFTADNTGVVCFASGTMILTREGEKPVERLRPDDLIATYDNGYQPLAMVASRRVGLAELDRFPQLKPIEFKPGALGGARRLIVSPQHAMLIRHNNEDHLVRARQLGRMKGGSVRAMAGCRSVTYFHIMFDAHQIVFANGRPTESFLPGPAGLAALDPAARTEYRMLFPDVFDEKPKGPAPSPMITARPRMRTHALPPHLGHVSHSWRL